jgi:hypothetical protein
MRSTRSSAGRRARQPRVPVGHDHPHHATKVRSRNWSGPWPRTPARVLGTAVVRLYQLTLDRDRHPRRPARAGADPARLRARAGRGGAGAVSGHAGDHRPGDRERLLLRLRPQRRRSRPRICRHREEDARDHRATRRSPRRSGPRDEAKRVFRDKGEAFKVELVDAIPEGRTSRSTSRASGSTSAAART